MIESAMDAKPIETTEGQNYGSSGYGERKAGKLTKP